MQRSARKVVEENARLKALLRHLRVEEHVIESWRTGEREEIAVRSRGCGRRGVEINEAVSVAINAPEQKPDICSNMVA